MLTRNEAEDRAKRIWGIGVVKIQPSAYIKGEWDIQTADSIWHTIDGNGHTTCHASCDKLEAKI